MRYEVLVLFPDGNEERTEYATYAGALAEYDYRVSLGIGEIQLNDLMASITLRNQSFQPC